MTAGRSIIGVFRTDDYALKHGVVYRANARFSEHARL
jgi:hypothetical protein